MQLASIAQLNLDKNKINKILINDLEALVVKLRPIYNTTNSFTKIQTALEHLVKLTDIIYKDTNIKDLVEVGEMVEIVNLLNILENYKIFNIIINIIKEEFNQVLTSNKYAQINFNYANLSQNYLDELTVIFVKVNKKNKHITDQITEQCIDLINNNLNQNIIENLSMISNIFKKYRYVWDIYTSIINKQLQKNKYTNEIMVNILKINESNKDFILEIPNNINHNSIVSSKISNTNPYLNTYNLVPISNLLSIEKISELLLPTHMDKIKNINQLLNICKISKYDLIVMQKYLNNGIDYAILDLLDYKKSMDFGINNSDNDGITLETISRFNNINYISDKLVDFNIKYTYLNIDNTNEFVAILEETYPGYFRIMSDKFNLINQKYFTRKSTIPEFLNSQDLTNRAQKSKTSRIDNYNNIISKKICNNMFLTAAYDTRIIKQKLITNNPNYLRYNIKKAMIDKYSSFKLSKNIYELSKIIHDKAFENIFSDYITNEYFIELNKNKEQCDHRKVDLSEIYLSFVSYLSEYIKDFKKKTHDEFTIKVSDIIKDDIFNKYKDDNDKINTYLRECFEEIMALVFDELITNEKNVFQSLEFKLSLFNLSYVD